MNQHWDKHILLILVLSLLMILLSTMGVELAKASVEEGVFTSCAVVDVPQGECEVLVNLYSNTNVPGWYNDLGWLTSNTVCNWHGISCFGGRVHSISLGGNNLTGNITPDFSGFTNLWELDLGENNLTGNMTAIIDNLPTGLGGLYINWTDFTGTIPASISNLTNLSGLELCGNQLTGDMGTIISNLPTSLETLYLWENQFTGTISSSISNLTNLAVIDLGENQLTGDLGAIIGNLPTSLGTLWLDGNQFTGTIPSTISKLKNLSEINISDNYAMSGEISLNITQLSLSSFDFEGTALCEPADTVYQIWKAGIAEYYGTGILCIGALNGAAEITSDQPIVAIGRPHIGTEIMAYEGTTIGATTSYLPMLFNEKWDYTSTFTVQNTGTGAATYTLTFKDAEDGSTSCVISGETLPQHGVRTYDVTNLGSCDSGTLPNNWSGGATITSDEPLAIIAKPDINGTDAVTYSAFTEGAATTYLPMLFRGKWGYQSAFYVQNLDGSLDATITIDFYDNDGNYTCTYADPTAIGSNVTRGYWMAYIDNVTQCLGGTGFPVDDWAGSAVVNSTGSNTIVSIGRPHLGAEVATYNGFIGGGTTSYLPMLFRGQWGYNAAFYIQNISGSDTTIAVTFYDIDGNEVCTYTDPETLGPNATRGYWTPALDCNDGSNFDPAGWAGSAKIVTSQNVIAVGRPHLSDGQVVAYNSFFGGATEAYVPFNFRKWSGNQTALYIQNLGPLDANTTITFYDEEDGFYCQMQKVVAPGSAGAIWLAALDNSVCIP